MVFTLTYFILILINHQGGHRTYRQSPFYCILITRVDTKLNTATHLNLGTTFHTTEKRASGDIATVAPCQRAHNTFRSSSTKELKSK